MEFSKTFFQLLPLKEQTTKWFYHKVTKPIPVADNCSGAFLFVQQAQISTTISYAKYAERAIVNVLGREQVNWQINIFILNKASLICV